MEAPNGLEIVRTTWNQFEIVLAEREGFEPSVQENLYAGFRIRCIRPLCHLSCAGSKKKFISAFLNGSRFGVCG